MSGEHPVWIAPVARIIARYIAGAMVAYGIVDQDTAQSIYTDPDMLILIGAGLAGVVEVVYGLAKRRGWST